MAEGFRTFGSHILFKRYSHDVLGHLYRAGTFDATGITRTVFLRTLDGPSVPAREVIDAFPAGQRVARTLVAANVAKGASFFDHDGVPALVCDYVPAQPLSTVLERTHTEGFPVPVDNALLILEKLALALSAALAIEEGGVPLVHGFLHPGLILVSTDGEALITGFGVAHRLLEMVDRSEVADSVHPYLAPEVLVSRTPSKRSDVYSLGAILLELLTGKPLPADPTARTGVLDRAELSYDERPLPEDIRVVLARAIASRPEERFSSAADFKKELDRLLYGGAYSPTTFNLALFMDRLFRSEIEHEERERATEQATDVAPYLLPEPSQELDEIEPAAQVRRRAGTWIAIAGIVGIAAAAVVGVLLISQRVPPEPAAPPTPTAEEVEARRLEEERRLQEMVQEMVQAKMAEKEKEIRQELVARQVRIEDLQRRLRESERRAAQRQPSQEEQHRQQQLAQQIAAEEEAQRQQEAALEAERQRRLEAPSPTATAATPTSAAPPPAPSPRPTVARRPTATVVTVTENEFVPPSGVDTLPVILKEQPVTWTRQALQSGREGVVIVQATVDAEGRVEEVVVLRADHEGFGIPQAVVQAVRKYRFKPALKDGVRVKSHATVTKRYRFRNR